MSEIPDELRYTEDHVWARRGSGSDLARIGITDYAQDSLGDIVTVTLPAPGQAVVHGQAFGEIESTKSISDLISPFDGTVRAGNDALTDTPEIVNAEPYGQGWILEVEVAPSTLDSQLGALLDAHAYRTLVGE
jgi:glycine cleavage system H protein